MFSIIGKNDEILYSTQILSDREIQHMHHFMVHSALDDVENHYFRGGGLYLGDLEEDRNSEHAIWCYVTSHSRSCRLNPQALRCW